MPLPVPALSLALALTPGGPAALSGCAAHDKAALRDEAKEYEQLAEATEFFWNSVRWGYVERASTVFEGAPRAARWSIAAEDMLASRRFTDVSLVEIDLHEVPAEPEPGRLRTATVTVKTEGFTMPAQVVRRELWQQEWYRGRDGWYIDWDGGEALTPMP